MTLTRRRPITDHVVTCYPDGTDQPGVTFLCADDFVSRVTTEIACNRNFGCIPYAHAICDILNYITDQWHLENGRRTDEPVDYHGIAAAIRAARDAGERKEKCPA